ncbi:MAG: hypothetical protein JOZ26_04475 [Hyphomicrobiales bacterium]|nr:hypothetical protein [Hyphomicrobiales bacterium]MBV8419247.1 hypothetical protein [Hyphomicrobiales bacterium]
MDRRKHPARSIAKLEEVSGALDDDACAAPLAEILVRLGLRTSKRNACF